MNFVLILGEFKRRGHFQSAVIKPVVYIYI